MNKRFGITLFLVLFLAVNSFAQSQKSLWTIEAKNPDNYVGAPIASGKIGIVPWKEPFSVQHVMLNHVFDIGDAGVNQALQGINPFHLELFLNKQKIEMSSIKQWKQSLDLKKATHTTSFIIPGKAEVRYTITALRNLPYSGLIEVEVKALDQIQMQCFNQMDIPNSYIDVKKRLVEANVGLDGGKEMILQAEALSAQKAHKVVYNSVSYN
ncbi:hypothetical protein [Chryseobacterium sp.]|uniref:hypothetical protein n=1 Tax=Chryseobacterium sp. TaxID=1871047 RepID=UPI00289B93F5|nr:hypothetical protein [Chryseobacterium sp.]